MLLRARCRHCRAPIARRYPLVEFLTGLLAVAVTLRFGFGPAGALYFAFGAALLAVTFIDLDWQIIPDAITLPGVVIGLAAAVAGAWFAGRALVSQLFEVEPTGWLHLASAAALLGAIAFLACLLPARKATRIDPATTLRTP